MLRHGSFPPTSHFVVNRIYCFNRSFQEADMAKSPSARTNGHTVEAMKPATPKKPAAKAVAKPASKTVAKPAVKAASKPAVKPAAKAAPAKPAVKALAKPAAKPVAKAAPKAVAKPAVKRAAKAVPVAAAAPAPAPMSTAPAAEAPKERARKPKLVRDSFTMPEQEYAVLGQVKKACIKAGFEIKKSELLRIGVALISQMDLATLQNVLAGLPQLKTGRPKNEQE
jgi:hypothetical protein